MNPDAQSLEAELRAFLAAPLDDAFLSRIESAADGTLTQLSPGELRFEERLRGIAPSGLTADFLASLETVVSDVPFPMNDKIVLFPKAGGARPQRTKSPMWAAAAAVALIGAATALLIPVTGPAKNPTKLSATTSPNTSSKLSANFAPAGFNRGVSNVHDEGVVWKSNSQPHNLMRVEYVDKITLKDQFGREFQVEQPGTRYMLVPAKTD